MSVYVTIVIIHLCNTFFSHTSLSVLLLVSTLMQSFAGFEEVVCAIGRSPLTEPLELSKAHVVTDKPTGYIVTDEYQNTSEKGVYALGDVCGKVELTPMAIAAGRRLADRYRTLMHCRLQCSTVQYL